MLVSVCPKTRTIDLCSGNLAQLSQEDAVDLLVVSAFPDDYIPTKSSLIVALHRTGVSVAEMALNKAIDLREFSGCWVSHPIQKAGVNFKRLVCFEPAYRGRAPEVVGDIFRCLVPLVAGPGGFSSVAMPLVASGDQGESPEVMLDSLLDAAIHWLQHGLSLDRICIVIRDDALRNELVDIFERFKHSYESPGETVAKEYKYDAFISYAHRDTQSAMTLVASMKEASPGIRLFVDRFELNPGAAWQDRIYKALDMSRRVVCAYSPAYMASKVCNEEFNLGIIRRRYEDDELLLPVYLRSAPLPTHMKQFQYIDAREDDSARINAAAKQLIEMIG